MQFYEVAKFTSGMELPTLLFRLQIAKNSSMCLLNTVEPPLVSCIYFLQIAKNSSVYLLHRASYSNLTFQLSDRKKPKMIFNAVRWP
jgi:hypothetical protein